MERVRGAVGTSGRGCPAVMLAVLAAILAQASTARADGELDPAFGVGGIVQTQIGGLGLHARAFAMLREPDGKLVTAGWSAFTDTDFALVRYLPDGSLDPGFGGGRGSVRTAIGTGDDFASALARQSDGKLIAAGYASNGLSSEAKDFAVVRYLPDGSRDPGFGSAGIVRTHVYGEDFGTAVLQQSDGRIVVAGYGYITGVGYNVCLVRYLADGTLDPSFGSGGKVISDLGASNERVKAMLQQPDGKLVVAGNASGDILLARYNDDGSLDPSFGVGGKVNTPVGASGDGANALIRQADGKLVAAGHTQLSVAGAGLGFALARYDADGTLDPSFGTGGTVTTRLGVDDEIYSLLQQPDGKLVAAGQAAAVYAPPQYNFGVARYNANGSLDTSFGIGGKVTTSIENPDSIARGVIQQPDGKLVAGGSTHGGYDKVALARYQTNGGLDASFGSGGKVATAVSIANAQGQAILTQADGNLIVAGSTSQPFYAEFALVRYRPDGSLDSGFGAAGSAIVSIGPYSDVANAVIEQSDGKLVAAGQRYNGSNNDFAVARFLPNGALDAGFGSGGIAWIALGSGEDVARAVVQQADGKLVVAGNAVGGSPTVSRFALVRYLANGTLDTSFGSGGQVLLTGSGRGAAALHLQNDGKLVAGGWGFDAREVFVLARLNADGTLDASFGSGGVVTTAFGTLGARALALARLDGAWLAGGYAFTASGNDSFALARYDASGLLDVGFGAGGQVTTALSSGLDEVNALATQPDAKVIAAGKTCSATGCDFALARYLPDGALDPDFAAGGTAVTAISVKDDFATSATMLPDGVVAAGTALDGYGNAVIAMARYAIAPPTPTPSPSDTATPTSTVTATASETSTATVTATASQTRTATPTDTAPPTDTETPLPTATATVTSTATATRSATPSATAVDTATATPTPTDSATATPTPSVTSAPHCGDAGLDPGEQCDDGNQANGDGCRADCSYELIPGNRHGNASTNQRACLLELAVVNPGNQPALDRGGRPSFEQSCRNGDPACDFDADLSGAACGFRVSVCLNNLDPNLAACAPRGVDAPVQVKRPAAISDPVNHAAVLAALGTLRDPHSGAMRQLPIAPAHTNVCSAPFLLRVPLRGAAATTRGKLKVSLKVRSPDGPERPITDRDSLTLVCMP